MYSPFFTSGFITSTHVGSPSIDELGPRRGSLPTNSLSTKSHKKTTSPADVDDVSAYYFTLQPTRNQYEFRSFLSLDLADSQSLRSLVHARRAPSSLRHSQSIASIRRPSRDSLRSIPSPKPAPSSTLPSPPSPSRPSTHTRAPSTQQSIQPTPSVRAGNYADALARLEGRAKDDFIILCDDDEEDIEGDVEMEPEDIVIPLSVLNGKPSSRRTSKVSFNVHPYSRSKKSRSKRLSTKGVSITDHSASFIDLGTNHPSHDSHWNWRSFIDVGGI